MGTQPDGAQVRRAAARRLGANWTELHRQEDEAVRNSPLHDFLFRHVPGVVLVTAIGGLWRMGRAEATTLPELLAVGAVVVAGTGATGIAWFRRRRAARRRVIHPGRRRVGSGDRGRSG